MATLAFGGLQTRVGESALSPRPVVIAKVMNPWPLEMDDVRSMKVKTEAEAEPPCHLERDRRTEAEDDSHS